MLRVATINVNGIRAAQRRGYESWSGARGCDVIALQEVRCPVPMLPPGVFGTYHLAYDPGTLAGRNGVAVLTREPPVAVRTWGAPVLLRAPGQEHIELEPAPPGRIGAELRPFVTQGRYVEVDLADQPLTVASLYLPKGGLPAELQKPG
ncbi:MAG: exodeoxyribonuclease III, partial [Micrococcales bacterium]|nr:exodeoxyribonuclease III [Micrococcales bacterium]